MPPPVRPHKPPFPNQKLWRRPNWKPLW
jgi:hypothetical protein